MHKQFNSILIFVVVLFVGYNESFANELCGIKVSEKFQNIDNNKNLKSQFSSAVPNLRYFYTDSKSNSVILLSENKLNHDVSKMVDKAELQKSADLLFNIIKTSIEPRVKIHKSSKSSYIGELNRAEVEFEYTENNVSVFEKRIMVLASNGCFVNFVSLSPRESKEKNNLLLPLSWLR